MVYAMMYGMKNRGGLKPTPKRAIMLAARHMEWIIKTSRGPVRFHSVGEPIVGIPAQGTECGADGDASLPAKDEALLSILNPGDVPKLKKAGALPESFPEKAGTAWVEPGQGATVGDLSNRLPDSEWVRGGAAEHLDKFPHDHRTNLSLTGAPLTVEDLKRIAEAK